MVSPETSSPVWDENLLENPHAVADKRGRVQRMFAAIAPSYDLNNRLHSLWMDQRWRRKAVKLAEVKASDLIVDVACGTGDLAIAFASTLNRICYGPKGTWRHQEQSHTWEPGQPWPADQDGRPFMRRRVLGVDFTFGMLPFARLKSPQWDVGGPTTDGFWDGRFDPLRWINGDAQALPLPDGFADVVSIAFGIRNVAAPLAAIHEFFRVLKPGGRLVILEFSLPTNSILRGLYNFYFRKILPRTATLISGDKTGAYRYLPESVNTFIGREQMMGMMRDAGFERVEQFPMTFGVCVCYRGFKGNEEPSVAARPATTNHRQLTKSLFETARPSRSGRC